MSKTLSYRLFKIGRVPKSLRRLLEAEGMLVCDEGIRGWFITKDFKAPGKRFMHRREGFSGFLAITRKRIIAYAYWKRIINIPFTDPDFSAIDVKLVNPDKIDIAVDSSEFHESWQGNITLRFNTPKAPEFYNKLMDMMSD